jgi:hypothetical protein
MVVVQTFKSGNSSIIQYIDYTSSTKVESCIPALLIFLTILNTSVALVFIRLYRGRG